MNEPLAKVRVVFLCPRACPMPVAPEQAASALEILSNKKSENFRKKWFLFPKLCYIIQNVNTTVL
jgi:hypothetical protein